MSAHDDVMEDRGLEGLSWFVAVPFMLRWWMRLCCC